MIPSTEISVYQAAFIEMGFVTSVVEPNRILCATVKKKLFGVDFFTGNRFTFVGEDGKFYLSRVTGHPSGDHFRLTFTTFNEVKTFVSLMTPSP